MKIELTVNNKPFKETILFNILYVVLCIVILVVLLISLMVSTSYFFHLESEQQVNWKEWISLIVMFFILIFVGNKMFKK
jgi:hypothetical protein